MYIHVCFYYQKKHGGSGGVTASVFVIVQMFYREGYKYISVSCTMNHRVCFATGRVVLVLDYREGYGYISM